MDSLILSSGGIKSAFLTAMAKKEGDIELLFFDFGQPQVERYWQNVLLLANYYSCNAHRAVVTNIVPTSDYLLNTVNMMCWALPFAKRLQCQTIYHGLCRDDWLQIRSLQTQVVTENFLTTLRSLLGLVQTEYDSNQHWVGKIDVDLPLYRLHMYQIIQLGSDWHTPWEYTSSCLEAGKMPCNACLECGVREQIFKRSKILDPLKTYPKSYVEITYVDSSYFTNTQSISFSHTRN